MNYLPLPREASCGDKVSETCGVFECRKCGQCCEGKGGIVLSPKDLRRLAAYLGRAEADVVSEFAEISNGKLKVRQGADGRCVFFREGVGCIVHEGKPDICRAWPFFRGNLEDESSFVLAREFCPGIAGEISHEIFVRAGLAYLRANNLLAGDSLHEANALILTSVIDKLP